ncbi:MAG: FAD:protein transferase [Thermoleophilaceae bacterium]|jgi:thiamine biosynthesis lipoprotein|nr:FAD:protein transferase [Thermoleophilaceae bacterium]
MRHAEQVMGTVVSFDLRSQGIGRRALGDALEASCAKLHEGDAQLSTWKPESPLSRIRRGELDLADAPPCVTEVLRRSAEARELSGGWFDPWKMPGGVDPTGLAKGWIAERALERLREAGVPAAMINAGGDVAAYGQPESGRRWRIGVRDPRSADAFLTVVELNGAVATSGGYERGHHILDPGSGRPAKALLSATVTGPDLALADALATGLFAAGERGLSAIAALEGYDALILKRDGSMLATGGWEW